MPFRVLNFRVFGISLSYRVFDFRRHCHLPVLLRKNFLLSVPETTKGIRSVSSRAFAPLIDWIKTGGCPALHSRR